MSSSSQIRQKLGDLAVKRAAVEKSSSDAESKKAAKDTDAANNRDRAARSSSTSTQKMYLRHAESAQTAALAEGKKIADLSKKHAALAKEEGALNQSLSDALKREASADATKTAKEKRERDAEAAKDKREREAQDRKRAEQRRADDRRRQQERLEDEHRRQQEDLRRAQERLDDQSRTASMIGASEQRLTEQIAAIRPPKKEQLRILYATAASQGDLRVEEEIRRVKAAVNAAKHRDQVSLSTSQQRQPETSSTA